MKPSNISQKAWDRMSPAAKREFKLGNKLKSSPKKNAPKKSTTRKKTAPKTTPKKSTTRKAAPKKPGGKGIRGYSKGSTTRRRMKDYGL